MTTGRTKKTVTPVNNSLVTGKINLDTIYSKLLAEQKSKQQQAALLAPSPTATWPTGVKTRPAPTSYPNFQSPYVSPEQLKEWANMPTVVPVTQESTMKDIWDAFVFASDSNSILSLTHQGVMGLLRTMRAYTEPMGGNPYFQEDDLTRKINTFQEQYDNYMQSHPEWQTRPEWEGSMKEAVGRNPNLLKSPAYWAYLVARNLPFTLGTVATTLGIGLATGNPMIGLAAGSIFSAPVLQEQSIEALTEMGADEKTAVGISMFVTALVAGIEVAGDVPFLQAIAPKTFSLFSKGLTKEISRSTLGLVKSGALNLAKIEATETIEEVLQQIVQNVANKIVNNNASYLDGVVATLMETPIATLPFGVFGGLGGMNEYLNDTRVGKLSKNVTEAQKVLSNEIAQQTDFGNQKGMEAQVPQTPAAVKPPTPQALGTINMGFVEPVDKFIKDPQAQANYEALKKSGRILGHAQLVKYISDATGVPIRRGLKLKGSKGALGIYIPWTKSIRLDRSTMYTVAHEIAHWLDSVSSQQTTIEVNEMAWLLRNYNTSELRSPQAFRAESFAELSRLWVMDEADLKQNAPRSYANFKQLLDQYPEVKAVWANVQEAYQNYTKLNMSERMAANMVSGSEAKRQSSSFMSRLDNFIMQFIDDLHPFAVAEDMARKRGIKVSDAQSVYRWARLIRGVGGTVDHFLRYGTLTTVFENGMRVFKKTGEALQTILKAIPEGKQISFDVYLTSRRILSLYAQEKTHNLITPKFLESQGIMTSAQQNLGATMSQLELQIRATEIENPEFRDLARRIYQYQKNVLDFAAQFGVFTQGQYNMLVEGIINNYVPFYRMSLDEMAATRTSSGNKRTMKVSDPVKHFGKEASNLPMLPPTEGILRNTLAIVDYAMTNHVRQLMAQMMFQDPALMQLFEPIDTPQMAMVAKEKLRTMLAETLTADEIDAMEAGLKAYVAQKYPGASNDVLEKYVNEQLNSVVRMFRPSLFNQKSGEIRVLGVQYNHKLQQPITCEPGVEQWVKAAPDIYQAMEAMNPQEMSSFVQLMSKPAAMLRAGAVLSPDFIFTNNISRDSPSATIYAKYGFFPFVDTVRGLFHVLNKDELYQQAMASGVFNVSQVSLDRQQLAKTRGELMEKTKLWSPIVHPLKALQILSNATEMATRVGVYSRALDKTGSPFIAGYEARDATVDYGAHGSDMKFRALTITTVFSNAAIQSVYKIYRACKYDPKTFFFRVTMMTTMPALIFYFGNMVQLMASGDSWEERWFSIPQWERDQFYILFLGNQAIRIPKPFELGMIGASLPERVLDYIYQKDPKTVKEWAKNFAKGVVPIPIPTAALPFVETWANKNFFRQRQIVPDALTTAPPEMQYTSYTSETAKRVGELVHWSPLMIDNFFQEWTGSLGDYGVQIFDGIMRKSGIWVTPPKPVAQLADYPILKSVLVRNPYGSSSQGVSNFYDYLNSFTVKEKLMKNYFEEKEYEKFDKYKNAHPEVLIQWDTGLKQWYSASARFLRSVSASLADLRTKEREILADRNATSQQKRLAIDAIDKVITDIALKAESVLKGLTTTPQRGIIESTTRNIQQTVQQIIK